MPNGATTTVATRTTSISVGFSPGRLVVIHSRPATRSSLLTQASSS